MDLLYIARQIDTNVFELLPDGSLRITFRSGEQTTLDPLVTYALYLFLHQPGATPGLRKLEAERQRLLYESRIGL